MEQDEVIAALKGVLETALVGDYPQIKVVDTLEAGVAFMLQRKPVVCLTIDDATGISAPCKEDRWRFLLNCFSGSQPYSKGTVYQAGRDDIAFASAVRQAINGDTGFTALAAEGVYQTGEGLMCRAWPEDQRTPEMINPQMLTCSTYD